MTTDEMASHSHDYWLDTTKRGASVDSNGSWYVDAGTIGAKDGLKRTTEAVGGNAAHNNMPPSVASYCWRRTV